MSPTKAPPAAGSLPSVTCETRGVLADAYTGKYRSLKASRLLTHTLELDAAGNPTRVLGGRCVNIDSLADVGGLNDQGELDTTIAPTCTRCLRHDPRHQPTPRRNPTP